MKVNEARMSVNANNLANVNTTGFKLDTVTVGPMPRAARGQSDLPGPAELAALGGGVQVSRTITQLQAGPLDPTGQPFDVALDTGPVADGFLGVSGADGKGRWTRDGRLTLDASGRLVTQAGRHAVLDEAGQPITLDPAVGPMTIDPTGHVRQNNNDVATLKLASFDRPDLLVKQGVCQFQASESAKAAPFRGRVLQGQLEGSAAEPTNLLVQMIQVQRAYEANANMIRYQDETLASAVSQIAKL